MLNVVSKSFRAFLRLKKLIILVTLLYIFSFLVGYILVGVYKLEWVLQFRENITRTTFEASPFREIISFLLKGKFVSSVLLTFSYNLLVGSFITTTLSGIVFFLPVIVTILRGWICGIIYLGVFTTPQRTILALGTLLLEFSAYSLSGASGIHLGLSLIFPGRYKTKSRAKALTKALIDIIYLYLFIIILLALGAIWEIGGIILLT